MIPLAVNLFACRALHGAATSMQAAPPPVTPTLRWQQQVLLHPALPEALDVIECTLGSSSELCQLLGAVLSLRAQHPC